MSIFGPLPPRADYTCPSHGCPERRLGVVEAIGHAAARVVRGARLLDDLVGAQQNRRGYGKTERLGGLEVQHHLELVGN
jgi:hypothetical protein